MAGLFVHFGTNRFFKLFFSLFFEKPLYGRKVSLFEESFGDVPSVFGVREIFGVISPKIFGDIFG